VSKVSAVEGFKGLSVHCRGVGRLQVSTEEGGSLLCPGGFSVSRGSKACVIERVNSV
jgi:hypothetical protein